MPRLQGIIWDWLQYFQAYYLELDAYLQLNKTHPWGEVGQAGYIGRVTWNVSKDLCSVSKLHGLCLDLISVGENVT